MTNEELKQWDEQREQLRLAIETATSEEEKQMAKTALEAADQAHQARFQEYTRKCQQDNIRNFIKSL